MLAADITERLKRIKWVLTDCDGVLTDGGVYYGAQGEALKRFNIRDGMGVERLRDLAGVETGIITGELSASVARRAEKLAIRECLLGIKDKAGAVCDFLQRYGLDGEEIAYIGDDANDLPAFAVAGISACPADAFDAVKAAADRVLNRAGGQGAFREFAELVIQANNHR
ncbi:MAG: KdsC family phosphatase [Gammaproteobacteria bacterium]